MVRFDTQTVLFGIMDTIWSAKWSRALKGGLSRPGPIDLVGAWEVL